MLGSYTHKFPKCGAALLTDLPELCLCLLEVCLSSELSVFVMASRTAMEGFRKCATFLKTRTVSAYSIVLFS